MSKIDEITSKGQGQGQITQQIPFLFFSFCIIVPLFLPQESILVDIALLCIFLFYTCFYINKSMPWKIQPSHDKLYPPLRLIIFYQLDIGHDLHIMNIYTTFHINLITQIIHDLLQVIFKGPKSRCYITLPLGITPSLM